MNNDVKRAFDALTGKRAGYNLLEAYYSGNQPTVYLTERLREIFRGVDARFTENWCAVVIDSVKDKINLRGVQVPQQAADAWRRIWDENQLGLESDDVHEAALLFGEAYLIAWRDSETDPVEAYFNDPRLVHMFYDAAKPRQKLFAAKMYTGDDDKAHLTLYYPDRLEYYTASSKDVSSASAFRPDAEAGESVPNPFGEIPVFHFRLNRRLSSDLTNVIQPQNGVNKLLADMMVAAEYGAFRQRWVISQSGVEGKLKSAPGEIYDLPAGDGIGQGTQVGEFSVTELQNYFTAIDNLAGAIGKITRIPKHFFYSQAGDPSGEALIAMEAPLNRKAQDRIDRFTQVWKEAVVFLLKLSGLTVERSEVEPVFDEPETIQPMTQATITQTRVSSGVPLLTALREEGWSEERIDALLRDDAAQKEMQNKALAKALLEAERNFNAGGE